MHVLGSEMCEVVDHQCEHICVSSPASYRCKCRQGFTLNPDGKTCKGEGTPFLFSHRSCSFEIFTHEKMVSYTDVFTLAQFSSLWSVFACFS